jgi:acyl-CoA thioester hydrolase
MRPDLIAQIELTPAFHDLDPMDVVWHGNYVKYLELARCALLQRFDYDYPQMRDSGFFWPIVDLRTKYLLPAKFGQRLTVRAELVEWEFRLKIAYVISDADTGATITRAETIQVAVAIATGEMCFASPPVLLQRLGVTP